MATTPARAGRGGGEAGTDGGDGLDVGVGIAVLAPPVRDLVANGGEQREAAHRAERLPAHLELNAGVQLNALVVARHDEGTQRRRRIEAGLGVIEHDARGALVLGDDEH
jgi:hypothetical protein